MKIYSTNYVLLSSHDTDIPPDPKHRLILSLRIIKGVFVDLLIVVSLYYTYFGKLNNSISFKYGKLSTL